MKKICTAVLAILLGIGQMISVFAAGTAADGKPDYGGSGILVGMPDAVMTQSKIFTDVKDEGLYRKLLLLHALGLAAPDKEAAFHPDEEMTRVQALRLIMPILRISAPKVKDYSFDDVPLDADYAADIALARKLGVVQGGAQGSFRPEEIATGYEFLTMLLNLMGYKQLAEQQGGYVVGYQVIANELKIDTTASAPLKRGDAAAMLYAALRAHVLKAAGVQNDAIIYEKETMMAQYYDVYEGRGQVVATPVTSIESKYTSSTGKLVVGGTQYEISGVSYNAFLGYDTQFYYRQAGSEDTGTMLCMWKTNQNKEVLIDADDVQAVNGDTLTYSSEGKRKSARLNPANIVIRNGKRVSENYNGDIFAIKSGTMKLLSANSGDYNLIFIDDYLNIVVESAYVDGNELVITAKFDTPPIRINLSDDKIIKECSDSLGNTISFETNKQIIYDADGKQHTVYMPPAIPTGCVLSIFADKVDTSGKQLLPSKDATYYRMIISTRTVSGTVEAIESEPEKYIIENTAYRVSHSTRIYSGNAKIALGNSVKFLLDFNARIAAYNDAAVAAFEYVYLIKAAAAGSALDKTLQLKALFSDGKVQTLLGADKIKLNGVSVDHAEQIVTGLIKSGEYVNGVSGARGMSQVVKLKRDKGGSVTELETVLSASPGDGKDEHLSLDSHLESLRCDSYWHFLNLMSDANGAKSPGLKYGTPACLFIAPEAYSDDEDDYGVMKEWLPEGSTKILDLYDVREKDFCPEAAVVFQAKDSDFINRLAMVMDVSQGLNKDGESTQIMDVCNGNESLSYYAKSQSIFDGLKRGDLVALLGTGDEVEQVIKLYSPDTLPDINTLPDNEYFAESAGGTLPAGLSSAWNIYFYEPYNGGNGRFAMYRGPLLSGKDGKRQMSKLLWISEIPTTFVNGIIVYEKKGTGNPVVRTGTQSDFWFSSIYGSKNASRVVFLEQGYSCKQVIIYNGLND